MCIFAAVVWAQNGGVSTKKVQQSSSLVVAAREFKPFTFYNKLNGIHAGIDYDLVVTIAKQLQVDVEFIRADKIDSTEYVFHYRIFELKLNKKLHFLSLVESI